MKTNPFHQTIIVTGGAAGIGYAVSLSSVRLTSCSTAVPARNWPAPLKNEVCMASNACSTCQWQ